MTPFLSVIVCTYNRAQLLPRALDSLLAQSEGDWEAIVIDDGSSDETQKIVDAYADQCSSIRYFRRVLNRGVGAARNIGVRLAKGQFLTFLDSDDEIAVDHLAVRKQILENNSKIQMLHGGMRIIGDPYVVDKDDPEKLIHLKHCKVGGTFVIRRDVFKKIGGFMDVAYAEDSLFFEKAVAAGTQCQFVGHPSYIYYRDTAGQLTGQQLVIHHSSVERLDAIDFISDV